MGGVGTDQFQPCCRGKESQNRTTQVIMNPQVVTTNPKNGLHLDLGYHKYPVSLKKKEKQEVKVTGRERVCVFVSHG